MSFLKLLSNNSNNEQLNNKNPSKKKIPKHIKRFKKLHKMLQEKKEY